MNGTAPEVLTAHGPVRGVAANGVLSFRGIPYAAPPVGPLRFKAASPPEPWSEVRDATRPGPVAPQPFDRMDGLMGVRETAWSEEGALHLTVHTPGLEGSRPVFVWIHGGSFTSGSSAWRMYDTEHFARDGVVGVGFNYRLGALGFADLRAHFGDAYPGNPALTDAVLALTWIRENIARFGGDPSRVTICGESAGAGMVTALMASPLADGLFHRVVPQSGMNFKLQEPDEAATISGNLLRLLGVEPGDEDALRALPAERILEASENRPALLAGVEPLYLAWNMHRDPVSLPRNVFERLSGGELAHLDMLIGTTADENKLHWLVEKPSGRDDGVIGVPEELLARLRTIYREEGRAETEWEISEAIGNDQSYLVPSTWAAEEQARHGGRVFVYLFTWRSPVLGGRIGACHALENAFVFDRLESPGFHGEHPPQRLADAMHGAWVAFAAFGDPQVAALPQWPRYDPEAPRVMELGEECRVLHDPRGREREAWRDLPYESFGVG